MLTTDDDRVDKKGPQATCPSAHFMHSVFSQEILGKDREILNWLVKNLPRPSDIREIS